MWDTGTLASFGAGVTPIHVRIPPQNANPGASLTATQPSDLRRCRAAPLPTSERNPSEILCGFSRQTDPGHPIHTPRPTAMRPIASRMTPWSTPQPMEPLAEVPHHMPKNEHISPTEDARHKSSMLPVILACSPLVARCLERPERPTLPHFRGVQGRRRSPQVPALSVLTARVSRAAHPPSAQAKRLQTNDNTD